jgi:pimeloyl-ACP methyl ester carboxylesterase
METGWRESWYHVNNVDLHVIEAGRFGDPLLVLLHGFPEFWWAWRCQISPLASAGYHVVVPDLRGYNLSEAPKETSAYRLDILTQDVISLVDAMGAGGFYLVGHDWGAVIGWCVAAWYPERVKRAVLISGPHPEAWVEQVFKSPAQASKRLHWVLSGAVDTGGDPQPVQFLSAEGCAAKKRAGWHVLIAGARTLRRGLGAVRTFVRNACVLSRSAPSGSGWNHRTSRCAAAPHLGRAGPFSRAPIDGSKPSAVRPRLL